MRKCLAAFALLLLLSSASAIDLRLPSTIVVQQEQKEIPVTILNDSGREQDYSIEFLAPFSAVATPSFGTLAEGKSITASLSVKPEESLEGSTYEANLIVKLGQETVSRNIRVIFKEEEKQEGSGTNGLGFFSLAGFSTLSTAIFTPENMLNGFLALIAAVLLIAFIARFVKRLEASK